jgi:hypothetical protein
LHASIGDPGFFDVEEPRVAESINRTILDAVSSRLLARLSAAPASKKPRLTVPTHAEQAMEVITNVAESLGSSSQIARSLIYIKAPRDLRLNYLDVRAGMRTRSNLEWSRDPPLLYAVPCEITPCYFPQSHHLGKLHIVVFSEELHLLPGHS